MFDATALAADWTAMWNGDLPLAGKIVAADFRIHFGSAQAAPAGDAVRGPAGLVDFVAAWRAARPGLTFTLEAEPLAGPDRFAIRWYAAAGEMARSGIDWLAVTDGRITEVWSIGADCRFAA